MLFTPGPRNGRDIFLSHSLQPGLNSHSWCPLEGSASPTIHAPVLGKSGVGRGGADDLLSSICGQKLTRTIAWLAYQKKDCHQKKGQGEV